MFDASCILPDQKCRELSVGTYSIHDNAVLCFQWILQGDGIQRHNRWRLGEKSGGGSFPFSSAITIAPFTILHPVNASESLEWTIFLTK